jgi:hypothetical protein
MKIHSTSEAFMRHHDITKSVGICLPAALLLLALSATPIDSAQKAPVASPRIGPLAAAAAPSAPAAAPGNGAAATCLGCHGPYEKVVKASEGYALPDGTKVNPHTSMDPAATKPHPYEKRIFECTNCHQMHPLPVASAKDVPKPNVEFCFSCHHERNFDACSKCHS